MENVNWLPKVEGDIYDKAAKAIKKIKSEQRIAAYLNVFVVREIQKQHGAGKCVPIGEIRNLWEEAGELAKYKRNDGTLKLDPRARMTIFERKLKELEK